MAMVRQKDRRSGITYVYESVSYRDGKSFYPKSKRRLIGRVDEKTGEVVPTDGRGKKRNKSKKDLWDLKTCWIEIDRLKDELRLKEKDLRAQNEEVKRLKTKCNKIIEAYNEVSERCKKLKTEIDQLKGATEE